MNKRKQQSPIAEKFPISEKWKEILKKWKDIPPPIDDSIAPWPLSQVSIEDAFFMVKKDNPNLELSYKTMDIWVDEVMKHVIPKPNPKCVRKWIETVGMLCFEPSIFPPPVELPFEIKYKYRKED